MANFDLKGQCHEICVHSFFLWQMAGLLSCIAFFQAGKAIFLNFFLKDSFCFQGPIHRSLLQLNANLFEGEPYNHLAQKNKRGLNVARQNSNISEMWETGPKSRQNGRRQCGVQSCVVDTQIFCQPPTHPQVKKRHLLTFKHKIRTSANNTDGNGTGYMSHNREICLH